MSYLPENEDLAREALLDDSWMYDEEEWDEERDEDDPMSFLLYDD